MLSHVYIMYCTQPLESPPLLKYENSFSVFLEAISLFSMFPISQYLIFNIQIRGRKSVHSSAYPPVLLLWRIPNFIEEREDHGEERVLQKTFQIHCILVHQLLQCTTTETNTKNIHKQRV